MKVLKDLFYTEDHEWVKVEGDEAYVGLADFAQDSLGDIVYVELPEVDDEFDKEEAFGAVESVKAASDVYAPISGTVVEVNEELEDNPALINESAFDAWIVAIDMSMPTEVNRLLSSEEYAQIYE